MRWVSVFRLIVLSLILAVLLTLQPVPSRLLQPVSEQHVLAQSGPSPWDISWIPSGAGGRERIANRTDSILSGTGLQGQGSTILHYAVSPIEGNPGGVNPAFALAMFRKEASFARPGTLAYRNNNPGNIRCRGGTEPLYGAISCQGGFGAYATMAEGIRAYFWLLLHEYRPRCSNIQCIISRYCPPAECETEAYIQQVTQWTQDYQGQLRGRVDGAQSATVLLVDVSGSMEENWRGGVKIESAKRAAADVINMIEQESQIGETDHQVAVATFTTGADLDLGLTSDYGTARQVVNELEPEARTNIGAGLQVANEALESAPAGAQKIIILLSDGLTNEGMTPPQILSGPVQQSAASGTCIYTVGFGEPGELDEQLLREIAGGAACGEYHYASAPAELEQVYIRLRHQSMGTVLAEFEGQVTQGETVQAGQVEVPRNQGQMHVTLHWPGSDLDLIVTDPRGRRVSETDPGVSLVKYGNMVYLIIENPRPGPWLLQVLGADVPEGMLDYDAIVSVRERTGSAGARVGPLLFAVGLAVFVVVGVVLVATQTRRSRGPSAGLRVVAGEAPRPFVPIRRRLTIGRHPRCDMVLPDPQVSARHATIDQTPQGYVLTDLNSKNGTYVNGQRVHQRHLRGGERLRLGQTELVFNTPGSGATRRPRSRHRAAPSASVAVLAGDQEFARYPVAPGMVLGRHEGCSVDLRSDALVSRRHARLDYQNGQWIITDLSSDNQTFVNGHAVTTQALRSGDQIQLGHTRMRFYAS